MTTKALTRARYSKLVLILSKKSSRRGKPRAFKKLCSSSSSPSLGFAFPKLTLRSVTWRSPSPGRSTLPYAALRRHVALSVLSTPTAARMGVTAGFPIPSTWMGPLNSSLALCIRRSASSREPRGTPRVIKT
jgi:hypothetical protein